MCCLPNSRNYSFYVAVFSPLSVSVSCSSLLPPRVTGFYCWKTKGVVRDLKKTGDLTLPRVWQPGRSSRGLCFSALCPVLQLSPTPSVLQPARRPFLLDRSRERQLTIQCLLPIPYTYCILCVCFMCLSIFFQEIVEVLQWLDVVESLPNYTREERFSPLFYNSFYHPNYTLFVRRFLLEMSLIHPLCSGCYHLDEMKGGNVVMIMVNYFDF